MGNASGPAPAAVDTWLAWPAVALLAIGVAVALLLHVSAMHTPFLQRVLELAPLDNVERTVLPLLAISLLLVMELHKLSWKWRLRRAEPTRPVAPHGV